MAAVAAASAELLIIGWYIFRVLLQEELPAKRILCQRNRVFPSRCSWNAAFTGCSDTPCRSWHIRCPGPVERCWGSAGSEPPTEAPAPSPGRPYHQVLLCISASKGANAAQEWGGPLCSLAREALAKVSEGPVGPLRSSTDNDEDIRFFSNPFAKVPLSGGSGREGVWGVGPGDLGTGITF
ncbi:neuronatin isoform X2 [Cavia porcellus]|uniref:neuronatin isoform X2 n=1 Tax=Cavia porcellus TaxID=10141 RepID=UPI002FE12C83